MAKFINQYSGFLRRIRWLYWLNNYKHRKQLQQNKRIYHNFGIKRSVLKHIDSRVLKKHVGDISTFRPKDFKKETSVVMEEFSPQIRIALAQWNELGFLKLDQFLNDEEVAEINTGIEAGLANKKLAFNYTGRKIFNAQTTVPSIQAFANNIELKKILAFLFQREALHFQTINFNKGSEQEAHSDSIHMTTLPLGYLVGVWVALEDIHDDNGPLTYFPGSHKMPYILNDDYNNNSSSFLLDGNANKKFEAKVAQTVAEANLKEVRLTAKAGDVFIWHANLLHGGAPINNLSLTRKSMVLHYFAKGVLCFHEISERPAILQS